MAPLASLSHLRKVREVEDPALLRVKQTDEERCKAEGESHAHLLQDGLDLIYRDEARACDHPDSGTERLCSLDPEPSVRLGDGDRLRMEMACGFVCVNEAS